MKKKNIQNMCNKNVFIKTYDREWDGVTNNLKEKLDFKVISLHGREFENFPTKSALLKKEMHNAGNLIKHLKEYNNSNIIICSNYAALVLLFLKKLHILKCNKIFWFGVYIHKPKMLKVARKMIHALKPKSLVFKIVVFSKPEISLYSEAFNMKEDDFIYVPYGEWNNDKVVLQPGDKGYYFSGGYANRDFVTLVKLFQNQPWPLIIAASKKNTDLVEYTQSNVLSKNITVYWDIPTDKFNELLRDSHAVIMIMKYNTGASGQIVLMTAMEHHKLVIASYTDVVDEYIRNGVTGLVLKDKSLESLREVMDYVNDPSNAEAVKNIAETGYQHYENTFSYKAISDYLVDRVRKEL